MRERPIPKAGRNKEAKAVKGGNEAAVVVHRPRSGCPETPFRHADHDAEVHDGVGQGVPGAVKAVFDVLGREFLRVGDLAIGSAPEELLERLVKRTASGLRTG